MAGARLRIVGAIVGSLLLFVGCSSGSDGPRSFTLGGTVVGLSGSGLILANGSTNVQVNANGAFAFPGTLLSGATYNVTVDAHPRNPDQECSVANGSGTLSGNVTSISVTCVAILTVASSTPAAGATDVARTAPMVVTFSAPIDATTVNDISVTFVGAAGAVPITMAASGSQLTVTPQSRLLPDQEYALSISRALRGTQGEALAVTVRLPFTTAARSWRAEAVIPMGAKNTCCVNQTKAPNGDPLLVWSDQELQPADGATPERLITEHRLTTFSPGGGWSSGQEIGTGEVWENPAPPANIPDIGTHTQITPVAAPSGEIFVMHVTADQSALRVKRFSPDEDQWLEETLTFLVPGQGFILDAFIGTNDQGEAVVVWDEVEFDGGGGQTSRAMSARFVSGQWSAPQALTLPDPSAQIVQFDVAGSGDAVVIWQYLLSPSTSAQRRLWATRYQAGAGWQPAEELAQGVQLVSDARLDVDADGDAMLIFIADDGTLQWTRYTAADGWSDALPVVPGSVNATDSPALGLDPSGAGFAIWESVNGMHRAAQIARYSPESGWIAGPTLDDASAGNVKFPAIAVGQNGDAFAVWCQQTGGQADTWAAHFADGAWQAAERIENTSPAQVCSTRVMLDAGGDATALWYFNDANGDLNAMFNRYE